ncbi:dephospho-CoA kinase [Idiomarina sp. OT37-5b]|jgi:dephospho-CoA kinase|uniref:dephospho-CoA kinase n=1 Tax=Idiomarina sp. OT37-5b TaxID=2100422 RepID=UPI0021CB3590|nr:dephospho-CoA kinase [Idiomarina sp. OT37-5b]
MAGVFLMSNYVVGLTGGIGSGKTAASDFLASLGIDIVDADVVAREVVEPGSPCLTAIAEHFGERVIDAQGQLNRRALRDIVFNDDRAKEWLNQLLHPAIRERLLAQLQQADSPYVVLVAPLLLENQLQRYCNRVLVIDVPEALQLERTMQRDNSEQQQVEAIMASQLTREQRLQRADDIVHNDADLIHLQQQLTALDKRYRQLAKGS